MTSDDAATSPVFPLRNRKHGVDARAQQVDGEFTVLTGSRIRASMPPRAGHGTSTARQYAARQEQHAQLIADGSAHVEGDVATLIRDVVFSSSSAAGAVVQGAPSANGRKAWVAADGTTFGAWEDRGAL